MSLTFVHIFLLYIIIFMHSLFTPLERRFFLKFYAFKIVLVFLIYAFSMTIMIWGEVWNSANPNYVSVTAIPGYQYFEGFLIAFIIIYCLYLIYFIIRAIVNVTKLPSRYSSRFRVLFIFSFVVLIAFVGVNIIEGRTPYTAQGFTFWVGNTIVLLYFCSLAFFFFTFCCY